MEDSGTMDWKNERPRDQAQFKNRCSYSNKGHGGSRLSYYGRAVYDNLNEKFNKKRVRVTCPACKRKMWGWAVISNDAEIHYYAVPPHKIKGWWKKGKKISRGTKKIRKET